VTTVGVHEAKTHLSRLLKRVAAGEEFVICNGGTPVARLLGMDPPERQLGFDSGRFTVPDDFDAPMPDEFYDLFEQ
jgi:prevent-host-death family protein